MMKKFLVLLTLSLFLTAVIDARHHRGRRHPRPPMGGPMFEKIDTDNDGSISRDEWMSHHAEMFSKIDKDGDGQITKSEMKFHREHMMKKHRPEGGEEIDAPKPAKKKRPAPVEKEEEEIGK